MSLNVPVVVSNVSDADLKRTRRGGATGIRAEWLRSISNLEPNKKATMTIDADNEDDFNRQCASRSTSLYRKNKNGVRALGFDPIVKRNWAERTLVVIRPANVFSELYLGTM